MSRYHIEGKMVRSGTCVFLALKMFIRKWLIKDFYVINLSTITNNILEK
jgi:hypothetical protein